MLLRQRRQRSLWPALQGMDHTTHQPFVRQELLLRLCLLALEHVKLLPHHHHVHLLLFLQALLILLRL